MKYKVEISYLDSNDKVVRYDEDFVLTRESNYYSDDYVESLCVNRDTFLNNKCEYIEVHVYDEDDEEVDPGMYLDIEDYGGKRDYSGDTRTVTMEQLEEILCDCFGGSEYDRSSGCNHNGKWFSIDKILAEVSASIW